jgi:hypothetical protein
LLPVVVVATLEPPVVTTTVLKEPQTALGAQPAVVKVPKFFGR